MRDGAKRFQAEGRAATDKSRGDVAIVYLPLTVALMAAGQIAAQTALMFNPWTYSADEDAEWVVEGAGEVPGNAWYIGPPVGDREAWLSALGEYRALVRKHLYDRCAVDIEYRGIRAWIRMQEAFAKALDLRPGEHIHMELEGQWQEGNSELVLALDLLSRETNEWTGWSTVFSTLRIPRDRQWHRLTWDTTIPQFDSARHWAKLIVGMDATHNAAPGHIRLRNFHLQVPERARCAVGRLLQALPQSCGLDRSLYERPDLAWASRAFVCHFTFMYDASIFDPHRCEFTPDRFIREGRREFGGYDAVILWHAYPRIGVDDRNQFDFYRDMPGGLAGLAALTRCLHRHGVKVFVAYNPWDRGTRQEGVPDEEALVRIIKTVGADGVFLDTMSGASQALRTRVETLTKRVVLEPEGSPSIEQVEVCQASWAQSLPELAVPGLLRLKWVEPRHMQHQVSRWAQSHTRELENAFFNGSGVLVWENVFGTWNPWSKEDRATLRRMAAVLRQFAGLFGSDAWDPMTPTLVSGVFANRWPGKGVTVWTIINRTGRTVTEPVMEVASPRNARWFDLWRGVELHPPRKHGTSELAIELGSLGCVAMVTNQRHLSAIKRLAERQGLEQQQPLRQPDNHAASLDITEPLPVERTPPARATQPLPGMVLVPQGRVTMNLTHLRRECGCYPDPSTPLERQREFLWGTPFDGTVEHRIGPIDLPAFFIDRHEVTNAEFGRFLKETCYRPRCSTNFVKHWPGGKMPRELADHPVVYVGLDDARAYARWAGKRLPTEAEWHRAAQGDDGRPWPWGSSFDPTACNCTGTGTMPVGSFPRGRSPFGCDDMAGNVWEWTESERFDGHTRFCIIRGGSWFRAEGSVWYTPGGPQPNTAHTKFILMYPGLDRCSTVGFRCVKDVTVP